MNNSRITYLSVWLWCGYSLVLLMVLIGGITRLTGSGLSITEWNLIAGTFPPMNESEWIVVFEKYKMSPEYLKINNGMDLSAFKKIFFWEYLHRLLGRFIGIVFLVPFVFFYVKKWITPSLRNRLFVIFLLGGLQGIAGWLMVKSGLVDNPHVSHYRLAIHLLLATTVMAVIHYTILELNKVEKSSTVGASYKKGIWMAFFFLIFQITYGAFVAGLKAGYLHNTYPKMGKEWIPSVLLKQTPVLLNFTENMYTIMFVHRWFGFMVLAIPLYYYFAAKKSNAKEEVTLSQILLIHLCIQIVLGVITIMTTMNIALAVVHQLSGILLVSTFTYVLYKCNTSKPATGF